MLWTQSNPTPIRAETHPHPSPVYVEAGNYHCSAGPMYRMSRHVQTRQHAGAFEESSRASLPKTNMPGTRYISHRARIVRTTHIHVRRAGVQRSCGIPMSIAGTRECTCGALERLGAGNVDGARRESVGDVCLRDGWFTVLGVRNLVWGTCCMVAQMGQAVVPMPASWGGASRLDAGQMACLRAQWFTRTNPQY
jgi:hypothetical protein